VTEDHHRAIPGRGRLAARVHQQTRNPDRTCRRGVICRVAARPLIGRPAPILPPCDLYDIQARDQLLSGLRKLVELREFEPLTPSMRTRLTFI
jgi:hypothetical protein